MLKFKIKNQKGISLIEAIVCISLVTLIIITIVKLFPIALKLGSDASRVTIATNLAQAKIEECFYNDYDNLPVSATPLETKHRLASDPANPFYAYQRATTVEYVDSNLNHSDAETEIKKVNTTVYWQSPILNGEKKVELKILISKKN
ncbi:MAG: type II secretion system protein [Patescibacteria group bacterium]|jgi:type II secretory pathway pseudopilin PulG